jgi:hypothetical protein
LYDLAAKHEATALFNATTLDMSAVIAQWQLTKPDNNLIEHELVDYWLSYCYYRQSQTSFDLVEAKLATVLDQLHEYASKQRRVQSINTEAPPARKTAMSEMTTAMSETTVTTMEPVRMYWRLGGLLE